MNQEEKNQMDSLKKAIRSFEQEIRAKDELITEQEKVIHVMENHIKELTGLLDRILKL